MGLRKFFWNLRCKLVDFALDKADTNQHIYDLWRSHREVAASVAKLRVMIMSNRSDTYVEMDNFRVSLDEVKAMVKAMVPPKHTEDDDGDGRVIPDRPVPPQYKPVPQDIDYPDDDLGKSLRRPELANVKLRWQSGQTTSEDIKKAIEALRAEKATSVMPKGVEHKFQPDGLGGHIALKE